MKKSIRNGISYRGILLLFILVASLSMSAQDEISKYFIGIELNGVLCGYSEVLVNNKGVNDCIEIDQKTYISFEALGRDINQKQVFTYHLDPETGNFIYHDSYMEQGVNKMSASMTLAGDTLRIESPSDNGIEDVFIPDNTILPNTMFFPYLKEDFGRGGAITMAYRIFNVRNGKVQEFNYEKVGEEDLKLNGKTYNAVIISESDPDTGLETTYWIDTESGLRLKNESQNNMRMYLTDLSVVSRVKKGSWDDVLFIRTNKRIENIRAITSMRVGASLEVIPESSLDDLNVTGQLFEGELADNWISGVFEVKHKRYYGQNAPELDYYNKVSEEIAIYLIPEEMIESNDSQINTIANEVTAGETNSWKAVKLLSEWVAENIDGSVYGGSAMETLERGNGACGSQSLLMAALCRAAGIPARVVWGCMYTLVDGGSFGHHGWNEVYMGEAGWIPIDVTSHEIDYVDSGHIRLGVLKTKVTVINFREMEILDYSVR